MQWRVEVPEPEGNGRHRAFCYTALGVAQPRQRNARWVDNERTKRLLHIWVAKTPHTDGLRQIRCITITIIPPRHAGLSAYKGSPVPAPIRTTHIPI